MWVGDYGCTPVPAVFDDVFLFVVIEVLNCAVQLTADENEHAFAVTREIFKCSVLLVFAQRVSALGVSSSNMVSFP